ncbi:uncharacterized protein RCC_11449 [Ramularia collo-cygni]|uniref:Transcriptional coactivator p15 (PC4) C-terminal domain-containing protein n=1 Tax=Ramularia collo-cygni TaxID=112498 RepID=A0A2D3VHZ8_9PEZI|nr:uncharacterized protein RCC_11449 [Ramularia collo-cygni]CZT25780.1 uncharacterized protein RCC_11449 [Ramularia collo-cygni]
MARPKQTAFKRPSKKRAAEEQSDSAVDEPQSKKVKQGFVLNTEPQKDDDGNAYWAISSKRRLQVSEFKGVTMVSIREFYEKDGKNLPGKGISLPVEQFNALCQLLPQVESVLSAKDLETVRPQYQDSSKTSTSTKLDRKAEEKKVVASEDDDDDEPEIIKPMVSTKDKLSKFKLKANHEATSDEDG